MPEKPRRSCSPVPQWSHVVHARWARGKPELTGLGDQGRDSGRGSFCSCRSRCRLPDLARRDSGTAKKQVDWPSGCRQPECLWEEDEMASVWRGRITFGLVTIPVRLDQAARRERISFRHVKRVQGPQPENNVLAFPSGSHSQPGVTSKSRSGPPPPVTEDEPLEETVEPVRLEPVSGPAGAPVQRSEMLKGYEVSKDQFVVFEPGEITALRPRTSSALELTEFVKLEEVDPAYYETSYYVQPDTGGEKAYALLFAALKQTGRAGIGSFAMHGREHV